MQTYARQLEDCEKQRKLQQEYRQGIEKLRECEERQREFQKSLCELREQLAKEQGQLEDWKTLGEERERLLYCWENKEREKQKLERLAGQLVELLHCQEDARRGLEKEQQQIEREEELIDKLKNQLGQLSGRDVQLTALLERRKALEQKYHALWECWRENHRQ